MKKSILLFMAFLTLLGCSEQSTDEAEEAEEKVSNSTSVQFRNMDVTIRDHVATMVGEASATNNEFYYVVLLGEKQLGEEVEVSLGDQSHGWSNFTIEIKLTEDMMNAEDVPVLHLYGKKDNGELVNPNYIPIDVHMSDES